MLVGSLLVVPIISILYPFLQFPNVFIPIAAVISFMGGLLRIIYAYMFEEKEELVFEQNNPNSNLISGKQNQNALPPQQSIPAADYAPPAAGSWHTTNDLVQPASVTESTTKLLQKED